MDRALWLLIRLRQVGAVRRWFRKVRSVKGVLLALAGSAVFMPMILSAVFNRRAGFGLDVETVRLYGPLALLAYCVLNVLISSGERSLYYPPAEVSFLFPGPFRPRQLVLYKLATGVTGLLVTAGFLSVAFLQHTPRYLSGVVGLFLALQFLHLFQVALGLSANVVGALAFSKGRRFILVLLLALVGLAFLPMGRDLLLAEPAQLLERLMASPLLNALLLPLRPAVLAFSSREIWPELVGWSVLAMVINLGLLGLILCLNAQFYESSAAVSSRVYETIRRARRGQTFSMKPSHARFRVPMMPWWGGAGPNLWRQLTTLMRTPMQFLGLALFLVLPALLMVVMIPKKSSGPPVAVAGLSVMLSMALIAPSMVGFDFRADLDRMETLKTLPLPSARLAIGQILTPAFIISGTEWVTLAILIGFSPTLWGWLIGIGALLLPLNVLLLTIENVYFLWFPFRMNSAGGVDFQAMGRQMLLFTAKFLSAGVAAALAAGLGAAAYFLSGRHWPAAFVGAWIGLTVCALATVPLVSHAFDRFDVTDLPSE